MYIANRLSGTPRIIRKPSLAADFESFLRASFYPANATLFAAKERASENCSAR